MSNIIRWLHISDFHVGKDNYEEEKIFKYILEHIEEKLTEDFILDFIFITGDIANRGLEQEYNQFFEDFLFPLIEILKFKTWEDKIFIVPGNHDLQRKYVISINRESRFDDKSVFFKNSKQGQEVREINEARAFEEFSKFIVTNSLYSTPKVKTI